MTHDFARQRAARTARTEKPASPPWLWFLSGTVFGTLTSFLVYLATLAPAPGQEAPRLTESAVATAEAHAASVAATREPARRPQFDFYTILPESEVIIAERSAEPGAQPQPAAPAPEKVIEVSETTGNAGTPTVTAKLDTTLAAVPEAAPAPPEEKKSPGPPVTPMKLLQAGSFRQAADANRRRADITLLGYPARVESVKSPGGETWYRVQVGPFNDPGALSEARGSLRDQGIETVEIGKRS
jgi:cell division protein FtsN